MKYELDQTFVEEVAAAVVRCMDEMSGSGTTIEQRRQLVAATINRVNDPPPEMEKQTITAEDVGTLVIDVHENIKAKAVFGGG